MHASEDYCPPPDAQGGWRKVNAPDDIRRLAGMDPGKLTALKDWLHRSDTRSFAAVIIPRGGIVPEMVVALVLAASARLATGAAIHASQEDEGTIRVVATGRFETTITARKGFGATFFDLKHDPEERRDLAPVADENGLLWTKTRGANVPGDGSWYANPPEKVELLEAGPVRARVRLSGWHRRYGKTRPEDAWKDLGFEQTFALYPTGSVYVDYALMAAEPVPLHHFLLIIKSTGAWGNNGKGEGRGEARCAAQHGEARPAIWNKTQTPFALQWTNGPTSFQYDPL